MSKCFSIALIALLSAFSLKAQEDISGLIRESLSGWPALANNVSITTATQRSLDQRKIISGTATAFGHSVGVEGRLVRAQGKNHLERLALIFPEATQLNRQHISQLAGEDMLAGVPEGLNANLKLDRLELDFFRKKVTAARVRVSANTWALIAGEDLKITSIQAAIAILDPTSSAKNLSISLTGSLLLPDSVASYFGLGATALTAHGYLDTKQRQMSLYAEISSEKIPIGKQDVLFLRNAFIELYSRQQEVGIALGGQLELNMPGQSPILLNGEVSIDLKAAIFGQAWMTGVWRNPFGISDQLYITNLGLGFGVDFSKLPYPLPIVAVEGGLSVGSPDPKKARFGGKVTLGLHAGNPSKNMLDARNINANLYDIISAFYAPGVPKDLAQTFKGIQLKNGRLTIVPPGDGVSLFGNLYHPGVHLEGEFSAGGKTGRLLIAINKERLIGYASLSAIRVTGFALTSADGSKGPEVFISAQRGGPLGVKGGFGLDGRLEVMGVRAGANVFLTDAGFNATLEGKVLDAFEGKLDVAGADIFKAGSIYVRADMKTDLFQRINTVASEQIGKTAIETNRKFEAAQAGLRKQKPILEEKQKAYEAIKATVRAEYVKLCDEKHSIEAQQAEREKEKKALNNKIKAKDARIAELTRMIDNGFKPAKFIKKTTCANISQYDPRNGGECWQCPSGYKRDVLVPVNQARACFKPAYEDFKPAVYRGKSTGLVIKTDCPSGAFYDPIDGGTCWSLPPGYKRTVGYSVKSSKATSKVMPEVRKPSDFLGSVACNGTDRFIDLRNGGECWECPAGYARPPLPVPVTSPKACERKDMATLTADREKEKALRTALIADRDLIQGKLGELANLITGEMNNACKAIANGELINADPRVAPKWTAYTSQKAVVEGLDLTLEGLKGLAVGTLNAAAWVAEHGGKALGVVDIRQASFEGCLSKVAGGRVALKVRGSYAGNPLDCSFDIDLVSPDALIRAFADALLQTSTSKANIKNGTCSRPKVTSPFADGNLFAELRQEANREPLIVGARPSQPGRPAWAGARRYADGDFETQLKNALIAGAADKLLKLSAYGLDLDIRDANQATPLMWVAHKGSRRDVAKLVAQGANPRLKGAILGKAGVGQSVGSLPAIAIAKGDQELLSYFVETLGLPVDDREYDATTRQENGLSPLERAAQSGKTAMVDYLVDQGAQPRNSAQGVMLAASGGHFPLAAKLLKQGFGHVAKDAKGFQALHFAAQNGQGELLAAVLAKGANVNAVTTAGWTPMILAAYHGHSAVCDQLIAAGANLSAKYDRKTASRWAKKQGFKELGKRIKQAE